MTLGRSKIDAALLQLVAVLGERRGERPVLAEDGIEIGAESARQMNDDQDRGREIARKFARDKTQRIKAAGGGSNGDNIAIAHVALPGRQSTSHETIASQC